MHDFFAPTLTIGHDQQTKTVDPAAPPHEFYMSICTIHHDPVKHALEITWRMTTHDLEAALEQVTGEDPQLGGPNEVANADTLIKHYVLDHLHLSRNDSAIRLVYLGREVELENFFCYLEADSVNAADGLTVQCDLLQEMFPQQVNEVHVETHEGIETNAFAAGSQPFTFGMAKQK